MTPHASRVRFLLFYRRLVKIKSWRRLGFWHSLSLLWLIITSISLLVGAIFTLPQSVQAQATSVQVGNQINFTSTLENQGDEKATNVVLTFPLPVGVTYDAGSLKVDGQPYVAAFQNQILTVNFSEVGVGVKKTLEWTGTVTDQATESQVLSFQGQAKSVETLTEADAAKSETLSMEVAPLSTPFKVMPSEVLVQKKDQVVEIAGPAGFKLTSCTSSNLSVVTATLQNNKCQLQILKNGNALLEIKESGGQKATVKITVNIPPPPKPKEEVVPPKKEETPIKEPVKKEAPVAPSAPEAPIQPVSEAPSVPTSQPSGGEAASGSTPTGEGTAASGSAASGEGTAQGVATMFGPSATLAPTLAPVAMEKIEIALVKKMLPASALVTINLRGHITNDDWQRGIKEGRLLIQSDPITQIFIPQEQNWSYGTKVELPFGQHQAQVAFVNVNGNVSAFSAPQFFEVQKPACGDGIDNDEDLQIDYPADAGCESLIDNNEKNTLIVQIMASPVVTQIVEATKPVVEVLDKKVLNNPVVEKANETFAAPAVAVVVVANASTAVASASLLSYAQLWLQYLQAFFSQPLLLLFKRRRKGWGVIYNALTKLPIDLALVRLVDQATGRIIQTRVTDKFGRYTFFVSRPGIYRLEAAKASFQFPTVYLKSKKVDLEWLDLYHGEPIKVETKGEVITRNIPVDPSEKAIMPKVVLNQQRKLRLQHGISLVGFFFSIGSLAVSPTMLILALLIVHIVTYFLFRRLSMGRRPKSWGVVFDAITKKPLGLTVARIFETQYNKLLETQIADSNGRYAFLVGRSQYYATFEKAGYQPFKTEAIDLTAPSTEAVIGMDVKLKKI